jgi:putative SOS response-associated peptidase YedK
MCGRYDLSENPAAIRVKFSVPNVPDFTPNLDVHPTETNPIVRLNRARDANECALARWGLVPSWAKDLAFGTRCINARAESLHTAPAFRAAYEGRRCLVPANAFYEWSGPKGRRIKWRVVLKDEPLFALAGLWEWWRDRASDAAPVHTYTIVTTDANAALAHIHDRMPVIIAPRDYARWLDPKQPADDLLRPYADELVRFTTDGIA